MSHTVKVNMIADQEIQWWSEDGMTCHDVNIYAIESIVVNYEGIITNVFLKKELKNDSMGSDSRKKKME